VSVPGSGTNCPVALLLDTAARVQRFVPDANSVLVNFRTRQDIAPDQSRDWNIAVELELIKWRVVVIKFDTETGLVIVFRVVVLLGANPVHLLIPAFADKKIFLVDLDISVYI
jgi:hypothetical protein